jgi:hypothetical protein
MNCETVQEKWTAQLAGELEPAERSEVEAHFESCPACAAEAELSARLWRELGEPAEAAPSARMRQRFGQWLADEASAAPLAFGGRRGGGSEAQERAGAGARTGWERRFLPLAAMLLLGLGLGYLGFGRSEGDVAELKREVGDLHEMVALSLLERGSVSERLQGVAYGRDLSAGGARAAGGPQAGEGGDDRIAAALFARLIEDPNVNVRLAALEALRPAADRPDYRGRLVAAVSRQDSPLVALSLVDLLLESGSPAARRDLEQLLTHDQLDPVVRGYLRDRLGRSA